MPKLSEVLGAIVSHIGKGRSQADMATLEIADIYKNHPLLSEFPVPRFALDEVVVDLKLVVAEAPASGKILSADTRSAVLKQIGVMVGRLVSSESSLKALNTDFPELQNVWKSFQSKVTQALSDLLPSGVELDAGSLASGIAAVIVGHVGNAVLLPASKVGAERATSFFNVEVDKIKDSLKARAEEMITKALESEPQTRDRLNVLVTASDLQAVPVEKVTSMKLTLRESDLSWTRYEDDKGETKSKLVPS